MSAILKSKKKIWISFKKNIQKSCGRAESRYSQNEVPPLFKTSKSFRFYFWGEVLSIFTLFTFPLLVSNLLLFSECFSIFRKANWLLISSPIINLIECLIQFPWSKIAGVIRVCKCQICISLYLFSIVVPFLKAFPSCIPCISISGGNSQPIAKTSLCLYVRFYLLESCMYTEHQHIYQDFIAIAIGSVCSQPV